MFYQIVQINHNIIAAWYNSKKYLFKFMWVNYMNKMTAGTRSRISTIEETINECRAQDTRIKSFAFLGAYTMASETCSWLKKNKLHETEVIERLQEVYKAAERIPFSVEFPFTADEFKEALKETAHLNDPVSGYAYAFAYTKLEWQLTWAKSNHAGDTDIIRQYADQLKGYHKDRSLNQFGCSNPKL
jgi:hypothetical protein